MSYCKHCGHELDDNSSYCSNCGNKVDDIIKAERLSVKGHTTLSIISTVLLGISCISVVIAVIMSIANNDDSFNIKFNLFNFSMSGIIGSLVMLSLSLYVFITYLEEVKKGKVSVLTKVLAFFVNFIAAIIILVDKEH